MNKKKEVCNKTIKDYIDRLTTPIFEKALQEDIPNSMTTTKKTSSILFKPNNYRLKINVKEKTNSTSIRIKGAMGKLPMELNINPHTKLISIKKYNPNITIQYGKNTLTAIYSQEGIYHIERNTIDEINHRITEIKEDIEKRLIDTLKEFSRKFNLSVPFSKPIWSRYEDWIKGDDYIDNLPRELILHDTYFKKVYGEGIEFKKPDVIPGTLVKTYIKNRAIEDIAPDIANAITEVYTKFGSFISGMTPVLQQINNQNMEIIKLRRDINRVQRKRKLKKSFNKDIRKWI